MGLTFRIRSSGLGEDRTIGFATNRSRKGKGEVSGDGIREKIITEGPNGHFSNHDDRGKGSELQAVVIGCKYVGLN